MSRQEIIDTILKTEIITDWHWFRYHFNFYKIGMEHVFAKSIVDALYDIGQKIEGAEADLIKKIASIHGAKKDLGHYEQLMQVLSEILVIHTTVCFRWNNLDKFEYEPTTDESKKNPEINIHADNKIIGIEVKSPKLLEHQENRINNPFQLTSRNPLTFPRDNPLKDFLISADEKFAPFKRKYENYISILFIVWDDYINEPISGFLSEPHGIFMSESFAKDKKGETLKFENVDHVIISRHRFQFQQTAGELPFPYAIKHPLDYGTKDIFPFKVIIKNPYTTVYASKDIIDCYQVFSPCMEMGAEYYPGDIIIWSKMHSGQHPI